MVDLTPPEDVIEQAAWSLIDYDTDTVDRGVSDEHYRERLADVQRVAPPLARWGYVQAIKDAQDELVKRDAFTERSLRVLDALLAETKEPGS